MPNDYDVRVTPSLIDRLIDLDPGIPRDVVTSRAESVRDLRRAVRRDLETLLNSRNPYPDLPQAYLHAGQSVLTYGLPDFSTVGGTDEVGQARLRQLIEAAIRAFEPRLAGATVLPLSETEVGESGSSQRRGPLRLRVEARLVMDPAPEPVSFDIVQPDPAVKYEVKEAS